MKKIFGLVVLMFCMSWSRAFFDYSYSFTFINNAVREAIAEDSEDFAAFEGRVGEPLISYDDMVKRLRKDGRI